MKPKVIIADDSLTIQKVIKITLANEDYELIECLEEALLLDTVKEHQPDLVLLDFNLSENKTGYDLAKEIKAVNSPKLMMLYGTFDTIDESLFPAAGVNTHIVKPFDGNKFINFCRQMVEDSELEGSSEEVVEETIIEEEISDDEVALEAEAKDVSEEAVEIDDHWVVNQPEVEESSEMDLAAIISNEEMNQLEAGINEWGMDIPGVIGNEESEISVLPPVIDGGSDNVSAQEVSANNDDFEDETKLPEDEDLEYPIDLGDFSEDAEQFEVLNANQLEDVSDNVETEDFGGATLDLEATAGTNSEEEVRVIEEKIADEVEAGDLWQADEVISSEKEEVETTQEVAATETQNIATRISEENLELKLDQILEPLVEKMIREKVDKIIEKISWEIIPDLAENMIKKELQQITNKVLDNGQ